MAVGSSTLATMRAAPPQFTQVVTSMLNTRLRRCAQVIERRRSSGVRGSAGSGGVSWVAFDGSRLLGKKGAEVFTWSFLHERIPINCLRPLCSAKCGSLSASKHPLPTSQGSDRNTK